MAETLNCYLCGDEFDYDAKEGLSKEFLLKSYTYLLNNEEINICDHWKNIEVNCESMLNEKYGRNPDKTPFAPKSVWYVDKKVSTGFFSSTQKNVIVEPLLGELNNNLHNFILEFLDDTDSDGFKPEYLNISPVKSQDGPWEEGIINVFVDCEIEYKSSEFDPNYECMIVAEDPNNPGNYPFCADNGHKEVNIGLINWINNHDIKIENNDFDKAENWSFLAEVRYNTFLFKNIFENLKVVQYHESKGEMKNFNPKKVNKIKTIESYSLEDKIISFLKEEGSKIPASDIDFRLKTEQPELIKTICEELFRDSKINRTGNFRYYLSSNEAPKEDKDIKTKLKELKALFDEDLISKEDYDKKKNGLLEDL